MLGVQPCLSAGTLLHHPGIVQGWAVFRDLWSHSWKDSEVAGMSNTPLFLRAPLPCRSVSDHCLNSIQLLSQEAPILARG